jgi:hypothetical protein
MAHPLIDGKGLLSTPAGVADSNETINSAKSNGPRFCEHVWRHSLGDVDKSGAEEMLQKETKM